MQPAMMKNELLLAGFTALKNNASITAKGSTWRITNKTCG